MRPAGRGRRKAGRRGSDPRLGARWATLAAAAGATGVAASALLGPGGSSLLSLDREELFPHEEHAGLFPTCLGCHAGIPTGEISRYYTVSEADCATCHDGTREERVTWREPTGATTNLVFSHPEHRERVAEAGDARLECGDCHRVEGTEVRMQVTLARADACLGCHAERRGGPPVDHLAAETGCLACHRPLAEAAGLTAARIAAFPEPSGHEDGGFLAAHASEARGATETCGVCHARESCSRCHLNADRLEPVLGLARDERMAGLVAGLAGEWPEPESHRRADFAFAHGEPARASVESCGNCHARPTCAGCHGVPGPAWLASLPPIVEGGPKGVVVEAVRPPGHDADFPIRHGAAAATDLPSCGSCHRETECTDCHDRAVAGMSPDDTGREEERRHRPRRPSASRLGTLGDVTDPTSGFHPLNFVLRHGAEAFAAPTECADCHSREVFCRSCHERSGFAASARRTSGAFHDAQPDWLLTHGQAARQNLEGCVGCHRQTSCLRCHSAKAGLRLNPHGPGFDPSRLTGRSTMSCGICHFADQILPP